MTFFGLDLKTLVLISQANLLYFQTPYTMGSWEIRVVLLNVVAVLIYIITELVIDDWKLKARTVVKLYRKNSNTLVSLLLKGERLVICSDVSFSCHKFFFSTVYLHCTEVKDLRWTKW